MTTTTETPETEAEKPEAEAQVPKTRERKQFNINLGGDKDRQTVGNALGNKAIGARAFKSLDKQLAAIPDPYLVEENADGSIEWSMNDRENAAKCEAGVNNLKTAFWVAGKSLDTICSARLYKLLGYSTFEEYVEERWDMARGMAYRLIREWRLGEQMAPIAEKHDHKLSESHVRAFRDTYKPEGEEAEQRCVLVFTAIAGNTDTMTAVLITKVVKHLPITTTGEEPFTLEAIEPKVKALLAAPEDDDTTTRASNAMSPELRKAVERRGLDLADSLKTSRIPQSEIMRYLAEAFTDKDDTEVFEAVLRRRKKQARKAKKDA